MVNQAASNNRFRSRKQQWSERGTSENVEGQNEGCHTGGRSTQVCNPKVQLNTILEVATYFSVCIAYNSLYSLDVYNCRVGFVCLNQSKRLLWRILYVQMFLEFCFVSSSRFRWCVKASHYSYRLCFGYENQTLTQKRVSAQTRHHTACAYLVRNSLFCKSKQATELIRQVFSCSSSSTGFGTTVISVFDY